MHAIIVVQQTKSVVKKSSAKMMSVLGLKFGIKMAVPLFVRTNPQSDLRGLK